jgi:hypothetical protein
MQLGKNTALITPAVTENGIEFSTVVTYGETDNKKSKVTTIITEEKSVGRYFDQVLRRLTRADSPPQNHVPRAAARASRGLGSTLRI